MRVIAMSTPSALVPLMAPAIRLATEGFVLEPGDIAETILGYGVDVMTSGNHIWDKKEALDYIGAEARLPEGWIPPDAAPASFCGSIREGNIPCFAA